MKTTVETESRSDAKLVQRCRGGDRDAFARIVERYQSVVCALTYAACGNLQTSEDLAQVTFITAWCELPKLHEPSKLKSWLCGIARNVTNNSFRQSQRTPTDRAEQLDTNLTDDAPTPREHAITQEEEAILWRALGELPTTYREPLVLFYRQHQSATEVAEVLGLSEDAVHQRLARGRTMLTERVAQFVETTLTNTAPAKAFTVGVLDGVSALAMPVKTATVGATAKAASAGGFLQTLLSVGQIVVAGGFMGYKMKQDAEASEEHRRLVARFWRALVMGLFGLFILPLLGFMVITTVMNSAGYHNAVRDFRFRYFGAMEVGLGILYLIVLLNVLNWIRLRRRALVDPVAVTKPARYGIWVMAATITTALLLWYALHDANWKAQSVSTPAMQRLIVEKEQAKPQAWILQYKDGRRQLWLTVTENGHPSRFIAPPDETTLALLAAKDVACPTYLQGRDFEIFGKLGKLLPILCIFVLAAGAAMFLKRPKLKPS